MTAHFDFTHNIRLAQRTRNRFTGTLRDVRALRVEWSSESEITLRESRKRLLLGALDEARAAGKVGERDYWVERGKLSG